MFYRKFSSTDIFQWRSCSQHTAALANMQFQVLQWNYYLFPLVFHQKTADLHPFCSVGIDRAASSAPSGRGSTGFGKMSQDQRWTSLRQGEPSWESTAPSACTGSGQQRWSVLGEAATESDLRSIQGIWPVSWDNTGPQPASPNAPGQMRRHRLCEPVGVRNMQCLCLPLKHVHTEFVKVWESLCSKDENQCWIMEKTWLFHRTKQHCFRTGISL